MRKTGQNSNLKRDNAYVIGVADGICKGCRDCEMVNASVLRGETASVRTFLRDCWCSRSRGGETNGPKLYIDMLKAANATGHRQVKPDRPLHDGDRRLVLEIIMSRAKWRRMGKVLDKYTDIRFIAIFMNLPIRRVKDLTSGDRNLLSMCRADMWSRGDWIGGGK